MRRRFSQVDVFASGPLTGNPLAVVVDAAGLDGPAMQSFARWMNLSETAFLLPPTDPAADYRVRIFTLERELPFAGHPTLGSASVWAAGAGDHDGDLVQECGIGLVRVRRDGDRLAFAAPPLRRSGPLDPALLADLQTVLGVEDDEVVDAAWVDNGPGWAGLLLRDPTVLARLRPDRSRWPRDEAVDVGVAAIRDVGVAAIRDVGVAAIRDVGAAAIAEVPEEAREDPTPALEVRAFFDDHLGRLAEDPVTGSLNASLAQWLLSTGRLEAPYTARQGTALGRRGDVRVTRATDGTVWVGGRVHHRIEGTLDLR